MGGHLSDKLHTNVSEEAIDLQGMVTAIHAVLTPTTIGFDSVSNIKGGQSPPGNL